MYNSFSPPYHTPFCVCDKPTLVCNKTLKSIYRNCVLCIILYISVQGTIVDTFKIKNQGNAAVIDSDSLPPEASASDSRREQGSLKVFFFFFFPGHTVRFAESQFPNQGSNPCSWQWKLLSPNHWTTGEFPKANFYLGALPAFYDVSHYPQIYPNKSLSI